MASYSAVWIRTPVSVACTRHKAGDHDEIGGTFGEHRAQPECRVGFRVKLRRISDEIEKVQNAFDRSEVTARVAATVRKFDTVIGEREAAA